MKKFCLLLQILFAGLCGIPVVRAGAQTFATLHSFNGTTDGANSYSPVVLSGNTLFGTTFYGDGQYGSVYSVNTDGTGFMNLHSFVSGGGANPAGGLAVAGNTLYGTTQEGGNVFAINTNGTGIISVDTIGGQPVAGVVLSGATLYGTTQLGGGTGNGSVFSLSTNGAGYTTLYSFAGGADGRYPLGVLVLLANTLYGTTEEGGGGSYGTVFKINTDGTGYSILHSFSYTDGAFPQAGLFFLGNTFYGTTHDGGTSSTGPEGTIFKINTNGAGFASLHTFTGGASDGYWPYCALAGSGNTLYGTTFYGGTANDGTIFAINTDGTFFNLLHSFTALSSATGTNPDGAAPRAGLILVGNTLYGTTSAGGSSGYGTVFSLTLPPPATTIDPANHYSYGANLGWVDWRGNGTGAAVIGEFVCSGYIYSGNTGWINLGNGNPANGYSYQNNSATDFGVNNQDSAGNLRGYAYGANIGWLNFEDTGAPAVNLGTGILSGYVWSANCGWMSLSNAFAHVQVDSIAPGMDSTGDGIADAWSLRYFGTTRIDPSADPTGKGMTLLQDYLAGTDPANPQSVLAITNVSGDLMAPGSLTLQWATVPTRAYAVQGTATIDDTSSWIDMAEYGVGAATATFSAPDTSGMGFYRIRAFRPLMP